MSRIERRPAPTRDGLTRRDFLHAGALAPLGFGLSGRPPFASPRGGDVNCIFLVLVGGPSQLDTWDMKPDAPSEIRGPFRPIATNVPGLEVSEIFPRLATRMDRVALVRTVHHEAAAVHDAGHQLMQTGRLVERGVAHPHVGSVVARLKGPRDGLPPHVLLPRPIGKTGGNMPHGQDAGHLGTAFDPFVPGAGLLPADDDAWTSSRPAAHEAFDIAAEPESIRDRYGRTRFGRDCLLARRLVERGVRFVTVNMYDTVFHRATWDAHGSAPFPAPSCYEDEVGPAFDAAYTALLDDLAHRGMLGTTMVLAFGEFGRTPRINSAGGRDHHPGCWPVLFAGGPIRGGQAVGTSDAIAHEPADRPVSAAEIVATVYRGLDIPTDTELPGPDGRPIRVVDEGVEPIRELF